MMVILQVVSNICEGLYFLHHQEQAANYTTVFKTSVITHPWTGVKEWWSGSPGSPCYWKVTTATLRGHRSLSRGARCEMLFTSHKTVCAWWRANSYAMWPCYAELSGSKGVNLEKIVPNPTVWVPCLRDEWQWVSLLWTTPSGIPGDLPEVL
jgi:hypothetical protein